MTDEKYTAKELEEMANALLTQDKSADKAKSAKPAVKAEKAAENPEKADDGKHPVASRGKLDEKAIAALPAAALLNANEKLKDLFVKGKKKGRLDAGELPTAPHRDIINSFLNCECKGTTFFRPHQTFCQKSAYI